MQDIPRDDLPSDRAPAPFPDKPSPDHAARLSDPDRLASLAKTGILDPLSEEAFNRVTRLATRLLGVEVSLFSVIDDKRQVFKAHDGLPEHIAMDPQTPLSHSFCQYVVANDRSLAVHDARTHPLLASNGATVDMNVIAYLGEPIHAPDGQPIASLCGIHTDVRLWSPSDSATLRDLAAFIENELKLRQEAQERALLLREMDHRVKNLFSVSSSLLRLTARDASDKEELVTLLQGRLVALSQSHDLALGEHVVGSDAGPQLGDLIGTVLAPYQSSKNLRITVDGPEITLSSASITYLALSLHELATNAAKYGALSGLGGTLEVSWSLVDDELRILWMETAQIAKTDAVSGFGSDLLDNAIVLGLGGACQREILLTGLRCTILLPVSVLR